MKKADSVANFIAGVLFAAMVFALWILTLQCF